MNVDQVDGDTIDGRVLLTRLWRGRWWIAACTLVGTVALTTYAFLAAPVYRSSTVLVSASAERSGLSGSLSSALGSLSGLASLAGVNLGGNGSEMEEALAVLRSREFTERFIADKQLMPVLFARRWDVEKNAWRSASKQPTPAEAYKYFDDDIRSVSRDNRTGLLTLHIDWRDRNQAASWANELVQRLNSEMRTRAVARTSASVRYLEKELESTSVVATRDAISHVIETQVQQRMLANVSQEYAFRVIDQAMPPDRNDPVRPKKIMLVAAGLVAGFLVGILAVLGADLISRNVAYLRQQV